MLRAFKIQHTHTDCGLHRISEFVSLHACSMFRLMRSESPRRRNSLELLTVVASTDSPDATTYQVPLHVTVPSMLLTLWRSLGYREGAPVWVTITVSRYATVKQPLLSGAKRQHRRVICTAWISYSFRWPQETWTFFLLRGFVFVFCW